ncbi:MAG: ABC transporter, ATP-binding protein, MsbA family [Parcubacteria group bacterium GW2011_GWC1_43_12]|nr:MAG: ABC transporter, ATP-binding protein, MsbA family [Parcubacteria group bacterium GW2011_GWC1_43_12]
MYGKYRVRVFALALIGFFTGFFDALSIGTLIPLFSFVTNHDGLGGDIISQALNKLFLFFHLDLNLVSLLIFISLLFILKGAALAVSGILQTKILSDYEYSVRTEIYEKTFQAKWPFLLKMKIGHLEHYIMSRVSSSSGLLQKICAMLLDLSGFLIYAAMALKIDWRVTSWVLLSGAVILYLSKPFLYRVKTYIQQLTVIGKDIANQINENILGLKTIKSMNVQGEAVNIIGDLFRRYRHAKVKSTTVKYLHSESMQPVSIILICVIFGLSFSRPDFSFATFIVTVYLIQRIFVFVDKAGKWLHSVNETIPPVMDLMYFQEQLSKNPEKDSGREEFLFNESIQFSNIDFAYDKEKKLFDNLNFKVKKGEMVGIIGPSGSGKTTIVDLLLRLFEPRAGGILIDGKNAKSVSLKNWRENIGYVSQDIFLKNDTVAENIKFFDKNITDEKMKEAAKAADIFDLVDSLPEKFETIVGERGARFSGGEKQRLVLARVLARRPQILILDEATSALDNESEILVKKSIAKLKGNMTIVVIAHRLSTVMDADRLLVLEKGKVVEEGSPDDLLLNKESYFHRVYNIG